MLLAAFFVLAFVMAALSDYLETRYVKAVQNGSAARAAWCSLGMWAIGVLGLVAVLEISPWIVLPEGAGMFFGTVLAMRRA